MLLGCIADDFTGGTDLASMLATGGMRVIQAIGVPETRIEEADAVVIALKSRTAPREQAVAESLAALRWLQAQGCRQYFFKYCSIFDSTPAGNISARCDDGWLLTPTGSSLGKLDPARISRLDWNGKLASGDAPSRENFLHLAMYQERPRDGAVIHLHSTHSVAVSVLADTDPADALPPLTVYYVMRIGTLPMVPYHAPGDAALADAVRGWQHGITRCCPPITVRSSVAVHSRPPRTRSRNWRPQQSSICCCAAKNSARSIRHRPQTCGAATRCKTTTGASSGISQAG